MKDSVAPITADPSRAADIQPVFDLCAADMSAVNSLIRDSLDSNVILIRQIAEYIIGSGGKRLRPMLEQVLRVHDAARSRADAPGATT